MRLCCLVLLRMYDDGAGLQANAMCKGSKRKAS